LSYGFDEQNAFDSLKTNHFLSKKKFESKDSKSATDLTISLIHSSKKFMKQIDTIRKKNFKHPSNGKKKVPPFF